MSKYSNVQPTLVENTYPTARGDDLTVAFGIGSADTLVEHAINCAGAIGHISATTVLADALAAALRRLGLTSDALTSSAHRGEDLMTELETVVGERALLRNHLAGAMQEAAEANALLRLRDEELAGARQECAEARAALAAAEKDKVAFRQRALIAEDVTRSRFDAAAYFANVHDVPASRVDVHALHNKLEGFLDDLDRDGLIEPGAYTVEATVTAVVRMTVEASDEDEARDRAEEALHDMNLDVTGVDTPHVTLDEVGSEDSSVDSVEADD